MGITTFTDEHSSPSAASRIFKASIVDSPNLVPKLMPQVFKSIEVQGDGVARSVRQINFADGINLKSLKYQIDELDESTLTYKYTLIEGDGLVENLEKITYEVKFENAADDGSIAEVTSSYYTLGDFKLNEDEIKAGKEKVLGMYKAIGLTSSKPRPTPKKKCFCVCVSKHMLPDLMMINSHAVDCL